MAPLSGVTMMGWCTANYDGLHCDWEWFIDSGDILRLWVVE